MTSLSAKPRYLLRWDHSQNKDIAQDVVETQHRLCELRIADDRQLIDYLHDHPRDQVSVHTMGHNPGFRSQWRRGSTSGLCGSKLWDAIRAGRLHVVLHGIDNRSEEIAQASQRLRNEVTECHVGLRIQRPTTDLVLASPGSAQYYGCESQNSIRWQLRGQQKVWTYPPTNHYIHWQAAESVIVQRQHQSLYYEPDFDLQAQTHQLDAGRMLSMPVPTPFRVQVGDQVSVYLRTGFDTRRSVSHRNMLVTNRMLRKYLPESCCAFETCSLWASAKRVIGGLCDTQRAVRPFMNEDATTFAVSCPDSDARVTRKHKSTQITVSDILAPETPTQTSTQVLLEN